MSDGHPAPAADIGCIRTADRRRVRGRMELNVYSAGEYGYTIAVQDGEDELIHERGTMSARACHEVFARMKQPGMPAIEFVREASRSKLDDRRQHAFTCRCQVDTSVIEFGFSGYFATDAELLGIIDRLRSTRSKWKSVGLPEQKEQVITTKKTSAKPTTAKTTAARTTAAKKTAAKTTAEAVSVGRKELIKTIADRTGIPPVDVGLVIDGIIKETVAALRANGRVVLRELGTFSQDGGAATFTPSSAFNQKLAE